MDKMCMWELVDGVLTKVYTTQEAPIQRVICPLLDGKLVCTGSYEGDILLWNVEVM